MAIEQGEYAKLVSKQMQMHSASAGSDLAAQGSPEQPRRRAAS